MARSSGALLHARLTIHPTMHRFQSRFNENVLLRNRLIEAGDADRCIQARAPSILFATDQEEWYFYGTMADQFASAETCRVCGALLNQDESQVDGRCGECAGMSSSRLSGDAQSVASAAPFEILLVPQEAPPPDPDRPQWGPATGISVWLVSVIAIIVIPVIAVVAWYLIQSARGAPLPNLADKDQMLEYLKSPNLLLVQVLSTIVAHAITIGICWAVVTKLGKQRFWASLGWNWAGHSKTGLNLMLLGLAIGFVPLLVAAVARQISPRLAAISSDLFFPITFAAVSVGLAMAFMRLHPTPMTSGEQGMALLYWGVFSVCVIVALLGATQMLSRFLPQSEENSFTELLRSSRSVRIAIAVLATFTAPLVEETVYRGVLFSSLRRNLGSIATVVVVTVMFAGVHVLQYRGAWVSISGLALLSLALTVIRARTRSILPCVMIHTLNNAFFSVLILLNKAS